MAFFSLVIFVLPAEIIPHEVCYFVGIPMACFCQAGHNSQIIFLVRLYYIYNYVGQVSIFLSSSVSILQKPLKATVNWCFVFTKHEETCSVAPICK